jgi:hypothetical protein
MDTPQESSKRFSSTKEALASLSENQMKMISVYWDKMNLDELARKVFEDESVTGQTFEGRAIKEYLIHQYGRQEVKDKLKTTLFKAAGELELTKEQMQFVRKNANSMRPLECTRTLFNNIKLSQLSREARAVIKYYKELGPSLVLPEDELAEEYIPVSSVARLIPRVNKYFKKTGDSTKPFLEIKELKQAEIRNLNSLLDYMTNYRFLYQINQYKNSLDRDLFESTFIEFLYDKPDCLKEDIHNYISLCVEIVSIAQIERNIQMINDKYNEILNGSSDEKMSVTLAETLDKFRQRQKDAKDKYAKLMNMLVEDRSKRTDAKIGGATLYNMVSLWRQEESRKKIIELAKKRQVDLEEEVERLSSVDALKAEICGLDKNITRM